MIKILPGLYALALSCAATAQTSPAALTEAERRGKLIFLSGRSETGGPVTAALSGVEVSAGVLPCGSCHGPGGRGNAEGGVQPSDIRWETLSRAYQNTNKTGRLYPPYTEKTLKKAITLGIDPGGNALHATMPRYNMAATDLEDLIAYLKRVGSDLDEGLTADHIKIACLLPPGGLDQELVKTSAELLRARFDQANQNGGIYGRSLELALYSETPGAPTPIEFLQRERPFALGCSFLPAADSALLDYLEKQKIPLCGALAENTAFGRRLMPNIFYLYAGLTEQLIALWEKASAPDFGPGPVVVAHAGDPADAEQFRRLKTSGQDGRKRALEELSALPDEPADALARRIMAKNPAAVLFLGGAELRNLLDAFQEIGFYPRVFAPGSRAGKQIFSAPMAFHKKVVLAYPTWMDQITDAGFHQFRDLQQQYGLSQQFQHTQMICLAAGNLLIDKMKACGSDLSREKLVKALENGVAYPTGLIPDLTYQPNKRVGSTQVFLLELDLEKGSLSLLAQ